MNCRAAAPRRTAIGLACRRYALTGVIGVLLAMPLPAVAEQLVFVTSTTTDNAAFPGLAGADAICANAASSGSLAGVWVAWLSGAQIDARSRLHGNGPFERIDGVQIAADRAALLDGTLDAPISIDENGNPIPGNTPSVWTGTNSDGSRSANTCQQWTLNSGGFGTNGSATRTDFGWTRAADSACGNTGTRLYCFQQGADISATAPLLAVGSALATVVLALLFGGWLQLRRSPRPRA